MTLISRFGAAAAAAVAIAASAGFALACGSQTLGCLETTNGVLKTNSIVITNTMPTQATMPANSWIYWKRSSGGDGKLTTTAAVAYKGSMTVARPYGTTSACTAYLITP